MKILRKLAPFLLAAFISVSGSALFHLVSERMPDYSGQVFPGKMEDGIQNVFHLDDNNQVVLYPWNLSLDTSAEHSLEHFVKLYGFPEDVLYDPSAWPDFFFNWGEEDRFNEPWWNDPRFQEGLCAYYSLKDGFGTAYTPEREKLANLPWERYIFFSEEEDLVFVKEELLAEEGSDSVGLAFNSQGIYYFHQTFADPGWYPDVERNPNPSEDQLSSYVEMTKQALLAFAVPPLSGGSPDGIGEMSSSVEEQNPAGEMGGSAEASPSPEPPRNNPDKNPLLRFLTVDIRGLELGYPDFAVIDNEQVYIKIYQVILSGNYSTLYQDGETLLAFSDSQGNTVVFFYLEEYDLFTGYSAHFADP